MREIMQKRKDEIRWYDALIPFIGPIIYTVRNHTGDEDPRQYHHELTHIVAGLPGSDEVNRELNSILRNQSIVSLNEKSLDDRLEITRLNDESMRNSLRMETKAASKAAALGLAHASLFYLALHLIYN